MLREQEKRRADFVEGEPILLENGETWQFPRPIVLYRVSITPDGTVDGIKADPASRETNLRFGQKFWGLQDRFRQVVMEQAEILHPNWFEFAKAVAVVGFDLLRRNYALSDEELQELFVFVPSDEANREMWDAIGRVVLGHGPKPEAAG